MNNEGQFQDRVKFPLVRSATPGSIVLTNEMIAEILNDEEASERQPEATQPSG